MKNNQKILIVLALIILIGIGFYLFYPRTSIAPVGSSQTQSTTPPAASPLAYTNSDYGFTFSLPNDWKGYSVVQSTWTGTPDGKITPQSGPKILIRNPNWTDANHYEDIPVLVFTLAQWSSYQAGDFQVSAAPFPAAEMARNNKYVFALPPRWDYDYSQGYQEADAIVQSKPLHPFNL